MSVKLDIIIVIDVEATCWKGDPPNGQEKEIIEIGVCLVDVKAGKRIDNSKRSIIVKPKNSTVSEYCTQLTNITQNEVNKGISLKEACEILKKEYLTKSRTWASWGDYDKWKFETECKSKNIDYPFNESHINVKNRFALDKRLEYEVKLSKALEIMNLSFEGFEHRGVDDAYNIALLLAHLISETSD
ncbi:MAG: exonuclease domain-containing protein [Promethearchaeota archaeon]